MAVSPASENILPPINSEYSKSVLSVGGQNSDSSVGSIAGSGLASAIDSLETIRHQIRSRQNLHNGSKKGSGSEPSNSLLGSIGSKSSDEANDLLLETIPHGPRLSTISAKKVHIDRLPIIITDKFDEGSVSQEVPQVISQEPPPDEDPAAEVALPEISSPVLYSSDSKFRLFGEIPSRVVSPNAQLCRWMLKGVDAVHVATVLQDCCDQLAVLGSIMPTTYETKGDAAQIVSQDIAQLVEGQLNMEKKYEQLMTTKGGKSLGTKSMASDLRNSTYLFSRSLKQSPLTPDNLTKVQEDRGFLEQIIVACLGEMKDSGGYQSLVDAVRSEKEKKAKLQQTILREQEGQKRIKSLQSQLKDVKKDKESEIQQRNEMIAHLKDQLQEVKAKTSMEGKYVKKVAEVDVAMTQKKCFQTEKEMKDGIDGLRQQIDEETRVNAEIESYLRTHQTELESKVEYWMEKYDKDVEAKQHELDVLKASKAKDLERLQELTKLYAEYEQIVVEDRIEKEKIRRRAEQEAIELNACITLQSWWRGVMVRKGLGPYSKKKKKKGKKGKKSGKKKKK